MEDDRILYVKEDNIGIITLNRPENMNAIQDDMIPMLQNIINEIILDDEVRVVIVTGNGRAFCAGTDVSTGVSRSKADQDTATAKREQGVKKVDLPDSPLPHWTFTWIPKPVICAVNGAAVGMGAEWAITCDIRIASEKARFGWVFPLRGLTPDVGAGPMMLPKLVGHSMALELMYSGRIINADEALRIGLVSSVVPPEELMTAARAMAAEMTRGAPLAVKGIKEQTYGSFQVPYSDYQERNKALFKDVANSEDAKEGVASFLEKRPPVWKGR